MKLLIFIFIGLNSYGAPPPKGNSIPMGRSDLENIPVSLPIEGEAQVKRNRFSSNDSKANKIEKSESIKIVRSSREVQNSNLPSNMRIAGNREFQANDASVLVVKSKVNLAGVHLGDVFHAVINQAIKASPSVPTPIRALVISGSLKGSYFVGEATLDKELKRILLDFSKIKTTSGGVYTVAAKGLSMNGSIGIEGEHHTQAGLFFAGELASATAAGVLDSTINRNQTTMGTYVQEPSLSNAGKTGAVSALSKTADRMAEQTRNAPEYTTSNEDFEIKVILQDEPTEFGG